MNPPKPLYHRRRFPPEVISHRVWLYFRFCLSYGDVGELMATRGVVVTHETIRDWSQHFGGIYAKRLRLQEDAEQVRGLGPDFRLLKG